jgi:general transcription factor 3C polypeptide 3 (transcription factor C subunit 4)
MGAHLKTDGTQWMQLGAKSRYLTSILNVKHGPILCRGRNLKQQALYCYRKACRLNPGSIEAHWEFATVCKEMGSNNEVRTNVNNELAQHLTLCQALRNFQMILKKQPHNISIIDAIIPVVTETRQLKVAVDVLQAAFDHYRKVWPHGPPELTEFNRHETFHDYHIIALADFLIATEQYDRAIQVVRSGARWLQGRRHEIYLDSASDDREFDADGIIRIDEDRLLAGEGSKTGAYHLDVNLRQRLAHARIRSGDVKEGRVRFSATIIYQSLRPHLASRIRNLEGRYHILLKSVC